MGRGHDGVNCACVVCYAGPRAIRHLRAPTLAAVIPSVAALVTAAFAYLVIPRFQDVFDEVDVPLPELTACILTAFKLLRWTCPLWAGVAILMSVRIAQRRLRATWGYSLGVAAFCFWIGSTLALFLPLIRTLQTIGGR